MTKTKARPRPQSQAKQPRAIELAKQPIAAVQWVEPKALRANSYNPNHVFGPEMRLLKLSILEHGWTQPIVARKDGEIVDGFHRWSLASKDRDIQALTGGLCPVVYLGEISLEDQMLATVRHNRARGQHGVIRMGEIVRALLGSGMTEEMVGSLLQMDDEEVERLADITPSPQQAGKDHFGKGWVPTRN